MGTVPAVTRAVAGREIGRGVNAGLLLFMTTLRQGAVSKLLVSEEAANSALTCLQCLNGSTTVGRTSLN
jgi:hypothetical protein